MHPEAHPILDTPTATLEQRVRWLELHLAEAWDQLWWLSLSPERRVQYEAEGFPAPIQSFYGRPNVMEALGGG